MPLFDERLLADLGRLPGAGHTFLSQLASADGAVLRGVIEEQLGLVAPAVADRWRDILRSLDNRRFFQGFAEMSAARSLGECGWRVEDLEWPGPSLALQHADHGPCSAMVFGFIRQVRPTADQTQVARLTRTLDRVGSRSRIAVLVKNWLPHDFDPEPVRRAIDLWLREVDRGGWDGRYAAFEDDNISLEFALTGTQAQEGQGVVAFAIGPFDAQRTLEVIETRFVYELDMARARGVPARPTMLVCVADQPWRLSRGYVRELLYGKPAAATTSAEHPGLALHYGESQSPCLFRDPLYDHVVGVVMIDRTSVEPAALRTKTYLNPWCRSPIPPTAFPGPVLSQTASEGDWVSLTWSA